MSDESAGLAGQYAAGDEDAAADLYYRYVNRLTQLARVRMSARLKRRVDPDDVVMSAYRSFFRVIRSNRYDPDTMHLWGLLAGITLRKLYREANHHQAATRDIRVESEGSVTFDAKLLGREPTPDEVVEFSDQLEDLMASLTPKQQQVLELRLQDYTAVEIAERVGQSERTVRRTLALIRDQLQQRVDSLPSEFSVPLPAKSSHYRVAQNQPESSVQCDAPLKYSDFLLQQLVGSGGIGKVYRATNRETSQTVAVKFLRRDFLSVPTIVQRFVDEASTIAKLTHPNIIQVHGLGRTPNGGFFIVIDYIEGQDLQSIINQGQPEEASIIEWSYRIAHAIQHSHEHGVIHCDLKPSNVLLGDDGIIHVTDFGMARVITEASDSTSRIEGTAAFMAPEQISNAWGEVAAATDVYGLGAVLYTLLTGLAPSRGQTAPLALGNVLTKLPQQIDRGSLWLKELCMNCLAKEPSQRPRLSEVISQLETHRRGEC